VVVPLGVTGQLPSFRSHDSFPAKTAKSIFPPNGQRNVGRLQEWKVWLLNMAVLGARERSSGEPAQTADHHGMAANENLQPLPAAAATASPAAIPAVDEPSKSPEPRGVGLSISPLILKQMEDKVVEEAQPLGRKQYTENSPSGIVLQRTTRKTAEVWKTVKRLQDVSLMGKILQNSSSITLDSQTKNSNIRYCHLRR